MPTIHLEADVSSDDLLKAVEQLDAKDFERFLAEVLALRARRGAQSLSAEESELLLCINRGLPVSVRDRLNELIAKRDAQTLSPDEHSDLLRLTDEVEALQADRAAALVALAERRGLPLMRLMAELGLTGPDHG